MDLLASRSLKIAELQYIWWSVWYCVWKYVVSHRVRLSATWLIPHSALLGCCPGILNVSVILILLSAVLQVHPSSTLLFSPSSISQTWPTHFTPVAHYAAPTGRSAFSLITSLWAKERISSDRLKACLSGAHILCMGRLQMRGFLLMLEDRTRWWHTGTATWRHQSLQTH